MKLGDFLINVGKGCMGAVAVGALGACAGYTYGTLSKGNVMLATQTLAIAAVAAFIFRQCVEHGLDMDESKRNAIYILSTALGGAAFTITLKNLEMISKIGTVVLGVAFLGVNAVAIFAHFNELYLFA